MPETYTDQPILTERFDRALLLATEHHRRQLRKGTTIPYVSHLLGVASLVLEMGGDETEAIGALLHDAVEDGGGRPMLERIRTEFGDDAARIVEANSDSETEPKPPWKQRKDDYLAAIAHKAPDELRVSLADKLHNGRAILLDFRTHGDAFWERFRTGAGPAVRWYYRSLLEAFGARRDDLGVQAVPALEEFGRTVAEIERLSEAAGGERPELRGQARG
jgi:(p)ppGpp synthase/HD superfamily hydrolase